jgi:hypothetical protein
VVSQEGTYFAENACKSHQYSTEDAQGTYCMLYCRVSLGDIYTTPRTLGALKRPEFGGKLYDSVVARSGPMLDHHNGSQVHREFIAFDRDQVYPEYCVYYTLS